MNPRFSHLTLEELRFEFRQLNIKYGSLRGQPDFKETTESKAIKNELHKVLTEMELRLKEKGIG